jgi:hypothetical protein
MRRDSWERTDVQRRPRTCAPVSTPAASERNTTPIPPPASLNEIPQRYKISVPLKHQKGLKKRTVAQE